MEWRPINWVNNLPVDKYSVSDTGLIRNNWTGNVLTIMKRKSTGMKYVLISKCPKKKKVNLYHGFITPVNKYGINKQVNLTVAYAVLTAFVGREDEKARVVFIDGNKDNCNLMNLRWEKHESIIDDNETESDQQKIPRFMSEELVREICRVLIEERGSLKRTTDRVVSTHPEVSYTQISNIKYKVHWANISDEYFEYEVGTGFKPI